MSKSSKAIQTLRSTRVLSPTIRVASVLESPRATKSHVSDLASARLLLSPPALDQPAKPTPTPTASQHKMLPPLSKMPTSTLLRSIMLNYIMASDLLRRPCMGVLRLAATSKLAIFNPEANPVLGAALHSTAYKQFCAGRDPAEVQRTIVSVKDAGFAGVVLCYGREVVLDKKASKVADLAVKQYTATDLEAARQWSEGLVNTLKCIGPGDILAIKFTGAGQIALDALKAEQPMPEIIREALYAVCEQASRQGSRLWLDAEQSMLQKTIDTWTIDLMRKYNRDGVALVSNTIQSYLKSSPENVHRHLTLAAQEGWTLGLKLVRGAYIESDPRHLLHDTIEETHACFDKIVNDLINMKMPPASPSTSRASAQPVPAFPKVHLFIATHNHQSVHKAQSAQYTRLSKNQPTIHLEFGQLQGMADDLSYDLVQQSENLRSESTNWKRQAAPQTFKYLTWGTLTECLGYLHRRAVENQGAVQRTRGVARVMGRELLRRITG